MIMVAMLINGNVQLMQFDIGAKSISGNAGSSGAWQQELEAQRNSTWTMAKCFNKLVHGN